MNRILLRQNSLCSEVQDTLEAYLADELDPEMHEAVAAHVAFCEKCQDEIRLIQTIDESLGKLPKPEPPPQVFDTVAAYVRAHPNPGRRGLHRIFEVFTSWNDFTFSFKQVGAIIALIGIALFGSYQYHQYVRTKQAIQDMNYALGKLNYAVKRTEIALNDRLPEPRLNRISQRPFVQFKSISRRMSYQNQRVSSEIKKGLDRLRDQFGDVRPIENSYNADSP